MLIFLFFSSILLVGNISIHSKEYYFRPNPNYFIISPYLTKKNYISISNSFFFRSFWPSFLLSKSTSFKITKSFFNFFLSSSILSNSIITPGNFKCGNQIDINKNDDFFIEECVFSSIGDVKSNGAIRIQNANKVLISKCDFLKCKGIDGSGLWAYYIKNITMIKNNFVECISGTRGSSAFVIMNSEFYISQTLVSKCSEESSYQTGIVYIKDSNGVFSRSSFVNNSAKNLNSPDGYAYLAFVNCPDIDIFDICFCYENQRISYFFMKIYIENCHYSAQNIVLPQFETITDDIIVTSNSVNKKDEKLNFVLNNTQNQICHIDNYVFEIGILPTQTPQIPPTQTPIETPIETPNETPIETPNETPIETPNKTPVETPIETPTEISSESFTDTLSEIEKSEETSNKESFENPIETLTEASFESFSEYQIDIYTETESEATTENTISETLSESISEQQSFSKKSEELELTFSSNLLASDSNSMKNDDEIQSMYTISLSFSNSSIFEDPIDVVQEREPKNYTTPIIVSVVAVVVLIIIIVVIVLLVLRCKNKSKEAYNNENTESSVDYEAPFIDSHQSIKSNPIV